MDPRQQRGLVIAAMCRISRGDGCWSVPAQSGTGHYQVRVDPNGHLEPSCTCPDFEERREPCKHIYAVEFVVKREKHADGSETVTETLTLTSTSTVAERPTYKQNWPAYNAAQTREKAEFQHLLAELCEGIDEPPARQKGRHRNRLADMVFAMAFKVYSTVSGRRFQTDLDEACAKGYLTKSPHFNSVFNYMEDPTLTPILHALVVESSLPLRSIESDFAVDSTGFTSSQYTRWFDHKYGRMTREHAWVKVHFMCGVTTNVVTAVEIKDKDAADSPLLPALANRTAENFTIKEVSADKGYSSAENALAIAKLGATGFIAFKKNATGGVGGVFEKMYHAYALNREAYLKHYHKRSNVESTVSMIKAKFGGSVRSKSEASMTNEALCKVLCHNLCCLIQSAYELGITAKFWGQEDDAPIRAAETADETIEALAWM